MPHGSSPSLQQTVISCLGSATHGCSELGYASLCEISALRGRFGLLVERDHHFRADKPLSGYADAARIHGRIVA
ncbi:DUF2958 domain-containing protein [Sinorhizobium meliloti]|uniref:DUF2958 domain-containing protein n=1 Tax=Rhizobium meliloti TaxID=382 RepID=UPI00399A1128